MKNNTGKFKQTTILRTVMENAINDDGSTCNNSTVVIEFDSTEMNCYELLNNVERFLKAMGYELPGKIIYDEKESDS